MVDMIVAGVFRDETVDCVAEAVEQLVLGCDLAAFFCLTGEAGACC